MEEKPVLPPISPPPAPAAPAAPPAPPAPEGGPLRPVGVSERIVALDVLRGFAILGIFMVNVRLMARPMAEALGAPADAVAGETWAWAIVKILCEYKFITMFSLLFGIGMSIQLMRAQAAGRPFGMMYLRRLVVLAGFGLVHALVIWYGDILFAYALCGGLLLIMARLRGRTLLITGLSIFVGAGLLITAFTALQVVVAQMAEEEELVIVEEPATSEGAAGVIAEIPAPDDAGAPDAAEGVADGVAAGEDAEEPVDEPFDPEAVRTAPFQTLASLMADQKFFGDEWSEVESIAYSEGPFLPALAIRSVTWSVVLVSGAFHWLWRVIGVFLIGAGLMKLRFFDVSHAGWHRRLCVLGLTLGLGGEALAAWLLHSGTFGASWPWMLAEALRYYSSALLSFGYVAAITLIVHAGVLRPVTAALAFVGRMALTNYLMQSVVATGIMYWWGLGQFGTWSGPALIGLVLGIYLGQIVISAIWLQLFRMGPLEWLWRSLTYLRPLRMMRS